MSIIFMSGKWKENKAERQKKESTPGGYEQSQTNLIWTKKRKSSLSLSLCGDSLLHYALMDRSRKSLSPLTSMFFQFLLLGVMLLSDWMLSSSRTSELLVLITKHLHDPRITSRPLNMLLCEDNHPTASFTDFTQRDDNESTYWRFQGSVCVTIEKQQQYKSMWTEIL